MGETKSRLMGWWIPAPRFLSSSLHEYATCIFVWGLDLDETSTSFKQRQLLGEIRTILIYSNFCPRKTNTLTNLLQGVEFIRIGVISSTACERFIKRIDKDILSGVIHLTVSLLIVPI